MHKRTLCFLVVGTSLAVLLQNLAKRRTVVTARPVARGRSAEIVDLALWRQARMESASAVSAT